MLFRYFLLCFQMTYGKVLLQNVKLDTVWGPVLYTNLLSIPPTIVLALVLGDFEKMKTAEVRQLRHQCHHFIILDRFSRRFQLDATPHARCDGLHELLLLVGC